MSLKRKRVEDEKTSDDKRKLMASEAETKRLQYLLKQKNQEISDKDREIKRLKLGSESEFKFKSRIRESLIDDEKKTLKRQEILMLHHRIKKKHPTDAFTDLYLPM